MTSYGSVCRLQPARIAIIEPTRDVLRTRRRRMETGIPDRCAVNWGELEPAPSHQIRRIGWVRLAGFGEEPLIDRKRGLQLPGPAILSEPQRFGWLCGTV